MTPPAVMWFRRDLRLRDHPALIEALRLGDSRVIGLFIIDPELLAAVGPSRARYLEATLGELRRSMKGELVLRVGGPAQVLTAICGESGATHVVATGDYAPQGRQRDERVARELETAQISMSFVDSPYLVLPGTVHTKAGTPSKVFTPFRRSWETYERPAPLDAPSDAQWISLPSDELTNVTRWCAKRRPTYFPDGPDLLGDVTTPVGEVGAWSLLESFVAHVSDYADQRNSPAANATSRLSPHLRFGTIHPRQVLAVTDGDSRGSEVFRSEIAWREFYADVLFHHPESRSHELQPAMARLRVDRDEAAVERFRRWARGETGYPLVDAGMRQLLSEGWMHNRVRMVCASFLVKHLHLDWRWGAQWFMWWLIDGDVASNQHGWQWTAGTGTDAAPFHRIFNPTLQAQRFDPAGEYVHRYVPELSDVAAPQCLDPGGGSGFLAAPKYVSPMIDLARERDEALTRWGELRELPS